MHLPRSSFRALVAAALAAACGGARAGAARGTAAPAPTTGTPAGEAAGVVRQPTAESAVARPGVFTLGTAGCPAPSARAASPAGDSAGARASSPDSTPRAPGDGHADVVVRASATVREITFRVQPEVRVRLCGGMDSVRIVERRNLPDRIVPGTTYRDVYVAVEILGHVDVVCPDSASGARLATTCVRFTLADSLGARRRGPRAPAAPPGSSTRPSGAAADTSRR